MKASYDSTNYEDDWINTFFTNQYKYQNTNLLLSHQQKW